jgi:hypothetical protein
MAKHRKPKRSTKTTATRQSTSREATMSNPTPYDEDNTLSYCYKGCYMSQADYTFLNTMEEVNHLLRHPQGSRVQRDTQ